MASKHDAKRARENFWVTQQNLAKQKGGRTGYTFKEKRPKVAPAPKPAPIASEEKPAVEGSLAAPEDGNAKDGDKP